MTIRKAEMVTPPTEEQLNELRDYATDGDDHEWGWYADHVPWLVDEIRRLRTEGGEAVALLRSVEWDCDLGENGRGCGFCQENAGDHHAPDCKLAAFLGRQT